MSRDAITGAEKGLSSTSEVTFERLEAWLDDYDHRTQLDTAASQDGAAPAVGRGEGETAAGEPAASLPPGEIEVVLNGPTTKWNLHWRGHREDAALILEQVQEILRGLETDDE